MSAIATADQKIYLVDAHAYLHRAYHAMPPLTAKDGRPVGALFGFARMLIMLVRREKPDFLAVCFDLPGPTFRHEKYKDYKATRAEIDGDLIAQLNTAEAMVKAMGIPTVSAKGYEADDVMATLARRAVKRGMRAVIVSGDKDALQLVDENIKVLNESKGVLYDAAGVKEKLGVLPEQVVDYLAVVGDKVDNVPGVPGIGAVGAVALLNEHGTLEKAIAAAKKGKAGLSVKKNESLAASVEATKLGRELIRLEDDVPLELEPEAAAFDLKPTPEMTALFSDLGFKRLLADLGAPLPAEDYARPASASASSVAVPSQPITAREVSFESVSPAEFVRAAAKTMQLAVLVTEEAQADLLTVGGPRLASALPDGTASYFSSADLKKHAKALSALLSSERVIKIGHDIKEAQRLLRPAGLSLSGPREDALLAAYCVDPAKGKYELETLLAEAGIGLPEEDAELSAARKAAALFALKDVLSRRLKEDGLDKLYRDMEIPFLDVLASMEEAGIAVDAPYLKKLGLDLTQRSELIKADIDRLAGVEINLKSPKQLAQLLFEKLQLPMQGKTKKGGISTDEETLKALSPLHPIPAKIIEYRELTKLNSTYVEALLARIDPADGRVHTHYHQYGTATGRLSSVEPNLQNIPIRTEEGRRIRRAFVAEKGRVLLAADYSQIDLRVLAHLSKDAVLCEAFRSGGDVHQRTASEVFQVPAEAVDKEMRRRAKAVNFGIMYGQNAHGLAQTLGIGFREAGDFIKAYKARYFGVAQWLLENLDDARKNSAVSTLLGRVRRLPDLHSKNFNVRGFNERVAGNTPIQGTSADIIKVAMINIQKKLLDSGDWNARMVLQVHDELVFELPKAELEGFARAARKEMEGAVALAVPLVVDCKWGADWNEMEPLA